jgi:membrane-associated protease RseP (regulator of RpoE activity)
VAYGLITLIYQLSVAVVARRFGVVVELVSVGFGPRVWEFKWLEFNWCFSLIPLGGYTKMQGVDELRHPTSGSFLLLSPLRRLCVILAGPFSNILLGGLLVLPAAFFPGGGLIVDPQGEHPVIPSVVPSLQYHATFRPESVPSLLNLVQETITEYSLRLLGWRSLDGWGGFVAWCVTAAAILKASFLTWLTWLGLLALSLGFINLVPIPPLVGGNVVMLAWEVCFGKLSEKAESRLSLFGALIALFLMARLFWADWVWLGRWYDQGMPC